MRQREKEQKIPEFVRVRDKLRRTQTFEQPWVDPSSRCSLSPLWPYNLYAHCLPSYTNKPTRDDNSRSPTNPFKQITVLWNHACRFKCNPFCLHFYLKLLFLARTWSAQLFYFLVKSCMLIFISLVKRPVFRLLSFLRLWCKINCWSYRINLFVINQVNTANRNILTILYQESLSNVTKIHICLPVSLLIFDECVCVSSRNKRLYGLEWCAAAFRHISKLAGGVVWFAGSSSPRGPSQCFHMDMGLCLIS